MKEYEAVFIFLNAEESYANGMTFVKEQFKKIKAKIIKDEDMKVRELAYQIKKQTAGHYHLFNFDADPDGLREADREFRLNQDILKFLIIRREEKKNKKTGRKKKSPDLKKERGE